MIPKIIHYVWVGDQPKSVLSQKCIASWKKYCPDFEIKEWNNNALNEIKQNLYVSQAIKYKKWAFVSDYLRLYALFSDGGIYLDTDCEITSSIEAFLKYSHVLGFEAYNGHLPKKIGTAFWGSEKGNADIKNILEEYNSLHFIKENGEMDLTANVHRISAYFQERYKIIAPYQHEKEYFFGDNGVIFPTYYFCKPQASKNNYAIHHFIDSWRGYYKRTLLAQLAKYKLVKFTAKDKQHNLSQLSLLPDEKILAKICAGKRYFCITVSK